VPVTPTTQDLATRNTNFTEAPVPGAIGYLVVQGLSAVDAAKISGDQFWVTPENRKTAEALKTRAMNDKAWVQRYLDGGQDETIYMLSLNGALAAPVKG
jgi:hypothetical protein